MKALLPALILAAAAGCATMAIPFPTATHAQRSGHSLQTLEAGRGLFVARCGNCHQTPQPSSKNAAEWAKVLPTMLEDSHLNPDEAAQVLAFLQALASEGGPVQLSARASPKPAQ